MIKNLEFVDQILDAKPLTEEKRIAYMEAAKMNRDHLLLALLIYQGVKERYEREDRH